MRRYILALATLFISMISFAQESQSPTIIATGPSSPLSLSEYEPVLDYKKTPEWGKYKALRAVGWTSLGVGVPATLTGLFLAALAIDAAPEAGTAAAIVTISGASLTLASIPLLVSAYHFRRKAKRMSLNLGISHITPVALPSHRALPTPALSFALTF